MESWIPASNYGTKVLLIRLLIPVANSTSTFGSIFHGMMLGLAFYVALNTDPDILIVNEILAAGDHSFQSKCMERIHQLPPPRERRFWRSRIRSMVENLCDRALWLDHGQAVRQPRISEVTDSYTGRTGAAVAQ